MSSTAVILVDVNLLLYAYHEQSPEHHAAKRWLQKTLTGEEAVGLPWAVALGFLRLTTDPRSTRTPITTADAAAIIDTWFEAGAMLALPAPSHWDVLNPLLQTSAAQ